MKQFLSKSYLRRYLGDNKTKKSFIVDAFITTLIFISAFLYVLETYSLPEWLMYSFLVLDSFIVLIFTIEILLRFWVERDKKDYFKSPYNWIDIIAVLPFWLGVSNLQFLRILRFFKVLRYSQRYLNVGHVLDRNRFEKLFLTKIIFILFSFLYLSSAIFYTIEKDINPSINTFDDALYFSIVTITTVGYGDIVPVSELGKWVIMVIIISGVITIPWFLGTLMRFLVLHAKKDHVICKECGLAYHDPDAVFCKTCGGKIYHEHNGQV